MVLTRLLFFIFQQIKSGKKGFKCNLQWKRKKKKIIPFLVASAAFAKITLKKQAVCRSSVWLLSNGAFALAGTGLIKHVSWAVVVGRREERLQARGAAGSLEWHHGGLRQRAGQVTRMTTVSDVLVWLCYIFNTRPHDGHQAKRRSSVLGKKTWKKKCLFALCQVCVQLSHAVT